MFDFDDADDAGEGEFFVYVVTNFDDIFLGNE